MDFCNLCEPGWADRTVKNWKQSRYKMKAIIIRMEWTSQSWQATVGERRPKPHNFTIMVCTRIIKTPWTLTSLSRSQTLDTLEQVLKVCEVILIQRAFFDSMNYLLALAHLLYPLFYWFNFICLYLSEQICSETTMASFLPSDFLHTETPAHQSA